MIKEIARNFIYALLFLVGLVSFELGFMIIDSNFIFIIQLIVLLLLGLVFRARYGNKKILYIVIYLISILSLKVIEYYYNVIADSMWTFYVLFAGMMLMPIPFEKISNDPDRKVLKIFLGFMFGVLCLVMIGLELYYGFFELYYLFFLPSCIALILACFALYKMLIPELDLKIIK